MVFFRPVNVWWFITVPIRKMHIPWHNFLLFFCVSIMPYYNCSCWLQWPQLFVGDNLSPWSSLSCWIVTSVLFKFLSLVVHSAFTWIQRPTSLPPRGMGKIHRKFICLCICSEILLLLQDTILLIFNCWLLAQYHNVTWSLCWDKETQVSGLWQHLVLPYKSKHSFSC